MLTPVISNKRFEEIMTIKIFRTILALITISYAIMYALQLVGIDHGFSYEISAVEMHLLAVAFIVLTYGKWKEEL